MARLVTANDGIQPSPGLRRMDVQITRNTLEGVAEEMAITHIRSSHSILSKDMLDFSTAVCDSDGRVVAQGLSLALQLGSVPSLMRSVIAELPDQQPGDVYILNHPWRGGVHIPDLCLVEPVFASGPGGRLIAYVVMITHVADMGGLHPGSVSAKSVTVWEEGLIIPPMRLKQAGRDIGLLDLIMANSRQPEMVKGDVASALSALEAGAQRIVELAERVGIDVFADEMDQLVRYSHDLTRAALMGLPAGSGTAADWLDDDGNGGPPVELRCEITSAPGHIHFDFTGCADQVPGGVNCTRSDAVAVAAFALAAALGADIPMNEGFYQCLSVATREGSVVDAAYPAAVGARATAMYRLMDVVCVALAQVLPHRLLAGTGDPGFIVISGAGADGGQFVFWDYVHAGWGASERGDGVVGVSHPIANAANIPCEVIERTYPLRMWRYGLVPGTGGAGVTRGADAIQREYEVLCDTAYVNVRVERSKTAPPGAHGGTPGTLAACSVYRDGRWERIPAKSTLTLRRGERLRIQLASGAGYGAPRRLESAGTERPQ